MAAPPNPWHEERYEIVAITASAKRHAHSGAADHTQYHGLGLGLDLAERLGGVGFAMETFRMTPEETVWHGLLRDLRLYVAFRELLPRAVGAAAAPEAPG